jgi:dipeptidyl aminopeptidase/acylaminoacyl peptidase
LVAILALMTVARADPGPVSAPPSAAELLAPAAIEDPQLSPDGSHIAARIGAEGRLAIFDPARPDLAPHTVALPQGERLEWVFWRAPGRLVASLSRGGSKPTVRLVEIDVTDDTLVQLGQARAGRGDALLHVDRKAGFLLLKTRDRRRSTPAVWRVDLATGAATLAVAAQPHVQDWVVDGAGVVRAGVGAKDDKAWLVYRRGESDGFSREGSAVAGTDPEIAQFAPVQGSDQGYALAEAPSGRIALYTYDFRAGRLGGLVYENGKADLDGFELTPDGKPAGVAFTDDRDRMLWFDGGMRGRQAAIDAALPGRVNRVVSASDNQQRLLVYSASASDPGIYYLFEKGQARRFAAINPALDGKQLSPVTTIHYAARDGLRIDGYLTLPAGHAAKDLPLIVMPHGGPFARDGWDYDPWVQYLAGRGYAVLQPNYRGSTGFGRAMTARGDGEWGRGMQDDADDGVAWLAKRGTIDAKRVCIMGASYGGYAAMWAAARDNRTYRCAISYAGISDVRAQLDYDHKTFEERAFRAWRARIQGKAPSLESISPVSYAGQLAMPILIAHGSADQTVPVDQSERLHAALTRAGKAHDFVVYPGEDHTMHDPANEADFLKRVGKFLDAHNPG